MVENRGVDVWMMMHTTETYCEDVNETKEQTVRGCVCVFLCFSVLLVDHTIQWITMKRYLETRLKQQRVSNYEYYRR